MPYHKKDNWEKEDILELFDEEVSFWVGTKQGDFLKHLRKKKELELL